jgi:hypothetical protein
VEVPLTCIFACECANRQPEASAATRILAFLRRQVLDQPVSARQPRLKAAIRHWVCTGSCDDPEILALFDHPGVYDGYPPRRAVIERVQAHLALDRVDQLTQLGLPATVFSRRTWSATAQRVPSV